MTVKNTELFGDRHRYYIKGRPGYPAEIASVLKAQCGLSEKSVVADIGAGTGLFTALLARTGCTVYGVEPNREMRKHAEEALTRYGHCRFIDGTAENTTLDSHSIDIVTVASALHWFDIPSTKKEFGRILCTGGWVAIINNRARRETEFEREYVELKKRYSVERGKRSTEIDSLYGDAPWGEHIVSHERNMDWDTVVACLLSHSTVPIEGQPGFHELMHDLQVLFDKYQKSGIVTQGYKARIRYGHMA